MTTRHTTKSASSHGHVLCLGRFVVNLTRLATTQEEPAMTTVNATIASPRLLLVGGGTVRQIAEVLGKFGLSRPLVVSDPIMVSTA